MNMHRNAARERVQLNRDTFWTGQAQQRNLHITQASTIA